jgi:hypothetical protein
MSRLAVTALLCLWCVATGIGLWKMTDFEFTAASRTSLCLVWPAESALARSSERPTLVMFVHPRCPCSRASLMELGRLAAQCQGRIALHVVFLKPDGFPNGWDRTALFRVAQQLPEAAVLTDQGGKEAACFGATTSGETFLFSPVGTLLFHGGLTASRGHEGENIGSAAISSLVLHGGTERARSPVFGCRLWNASSPPDEVEPLCLP